MGVALLSLPGDCRGGVPPCRLAAENTTNPHDQEMVFPSIAFGAVCPDSREPVGLGSRSLWVLACAVQCSAIEVALAHQGARTEKRADVSSK